VAATLFVERARKLWQADQTLTERGERTLENAVVAGPALLELIEKFALMFQLGLHPGAHEAQAIGRFGGLDLSAANGGRAPHARLPDPAKGIAVAVQKDQIDVVRDCQLDGVARQQHAGGDEDALDFVGRHFELLCARRDREAVAEFAKAGTRGIDDQLHGATSCRSSSSLVIAKTVLMSRVS
jgi:hypothetical protein